MLIKNNYISDLKSRHAQMYTLAVLDTWFSNISLNFYSSDKINNNLVLGKEKHPKEKSLHINNKIIISGVFSGSRTIFFMCLVLKWDLETPEGVMLFLIIEYSIQSKRLCTLARRLEKDKCLEHSWT